MATISKINDILCANVAKVDDILKANVSKWDDNTFCPSSPTPTQTPTQTPGGSANPTPTPTVTPTYTPTQTVTPTYTPTSTPTPTPTETVPCGRGCCFVELCFDETDCTNACACNTTRNVYLSQPCKNDPCRLEFADGIFDDDFCSTPAPIGYYSDVNNCYYWDQTTLTLQGPC